MRDWIQHVLIASPQLYELRLSQGQVGYAPNVRVRDWIQHVLIVSRQLDQLRLRQGQVGYAPNVRVRDWIQHVLIVSPQIYESLRWTLASVSLLSDRRISSDLISPSVSSFSRKREVLKSDKNYDRNVSYYNLEDDGDSFWTRNNKWSTRMFYLLRNVAQLIVCHVRFR